MDIKYGILFSSPISNILLALCFHTHYLVLALTETTTYSVFKNNQLSAFC